MKKNVILYTITILTILMIVFTPTAIAMFIPSARLVMLSKESYSELVTANGSIEEKSVKNITTDYPLVPKTVYCETDDNIKKGETLADVDKEATMSVIRSVYKSNPSSLPSELAVAAQSESLSSLQTESMIPDKIIASTSGRLSSVNLTSGSVCEAGVVATVAQENNLCARIQVNESDINRVYKGQEVTLSGSGFAGKSYKGKITKIYPTAKKQLSSTMQETVVEVMASIDNCNKKVKAGFTVTADIKVSKPKAVNVLPYEAISQDSNGNEFVYVYKNGKAVKQAVTTGAALKNGQVIISGVSKTDFVIYKADSLKQDEEFVNIILDSVKD